MRRLLHAMRRAASYIESSRRDPFRCLNNERNADFDRAAFLLISPPLAVLLLFKVATGEMQLALALRLSLWVVAAQGMALLISCRRSVYVRHRELLFTALLTVCISTTLDGSLNSAFNIIESHGGSPLRLLAALSIFNASLSMATSGMYGRLGMGWSRVALPLLSFLPLWWAKPLCHRVLQAPGVQQPLHELHSVLGAIHSAALYEGRSATWRLRSSMDECLLVHSYLVLAVGMLLPLAALHQLEQEARRQQQQPLGQADQAQQQQGEHEDLHWWPEAPADGCLKPFLTAYLLSCLVWTGVTSMLDASNAWAP